MATTLKDNVKGLSEPTQKEEEFGQIIWDHNQLGHVLKPAYAVIGLGSPDMLPAETAAEIFLNGYAPTIMFTGKGGRNTEKLPRGRKGITEARMMSETAIEYARKRGYLDEKIEYLKERMLFEEQATNSGENVIFTMRVLERKAEKDSIEIDRLIFAHMPSAERRDYKTIRHHMPDKNIDVVMVSPRVPFSRYHLEGYQSTFTRRDLIEDMLGDTQRQYVCHINNPEIFLTFGYTDKQDAPMPSNVLDAYNELVDRGFTAQLMKYNSGPDKGKIIPIEVGFE